MHARLRPTLATLAALLLATMTLALAPAAQAVTTYDDPQGKIISLTNAHRSKHDGLGALTRSSSLDAVAQAWAEKLAADYAKAKAKNSSASPTDTLAHNPNYADQIPAGWTAAGENVAWNKGYSDPVTKLVNQWINSSGHHANLASTKYTHMGAGYYVDQYGVSWGVQVFAKYSSNPDPAKEDATLSATVQAADTISLDRGNTYYIKDHLGPGEAERVVSFGKSNDQVLVGDWDGDGVDTIALKRGNTYYIKNYLGTGPLWAKVSFGKASDTALVGDWDGDGVDTIALKRGNTYYVKNYLGMGPLDAKVSFGYGSDTALVGDWDGDGVDTIALKRGNTYYVKNYLGMGPLDAKYRFGRSDEQVIVGNWDGE